MSSITRRQPVNHQLRLDKVLWGCCGRLELALMWVTHGVRYKSTGAVLSAEAAGESETSRQSSALLAVVSGAWSHPLYICSSPLW